MAWIRAGSLAALPPGSVVEVLSGGAAYAVCNVGGEVHAIGGICPHRGGPLGHGGLDADGILCCPWHAWEFDCRTGADPRNPGVSVPKYSARIDGDDILIEVP